MKNPIEKKYSSYEAKDIFVLEGLEPVRKRPGMYIGSTGPEGLHHLIWECADNALDEFAMGFGDTMVVKLLPGNKVSVSDNGRGIPVDIHPQTKKSALETVMTTLHAGAKFGSKAYKATGGLHGVGVSVVCALSKWMRAEVCRNGAKYYQEYMRGKPITPVKKEGSCDTTGTTVIFEPDPEIFPKIEFDIKKILNHFRQQAYLSKKVKIIIKDERKKPFFSYTFYFEGGLFSYLKYYLAKDAQIIHPNIFYATSQENDILMEAAFCYTTEYETYEESFVNNIFTSEGGTHLTGFRTALTKVLNDWARKNDYLKEKDESLIGEDIREGLIGVISIKIPEPQFEGQTKQKLGNPEAKIAVEKFLTQAIYDYLDRYPQDARLIIEKCLLAQRARKAAKTAKENILKKGVLEGLALPGKLADCISKKPEESELFIVEGESAGGSSRQARDRYFQAILPLKGKILNVERARLDKILASKEVRALILALGTAIAEDFNIEKLRYHKIIIMTDADSDGNHIKTLILTLFYRYFKEIIERGYLYVAQPPLYQIQIGKEIKYAYSDEEKEKILKSIKSSQPINIKRYKGLGEMNPEELWETTMNPQNRILIQVSLKDAKEADRIFDVLMGEEVLPRKKFIEHFAKEAKNLDI
jgi:DNA gyrase subunit B